MGERGVSSVPHVRSNGRSTQTLRARTAKSGLVLIGPEKTASMISTQQLQPQAAAAYAISWTLDCTVVVTSMRRNDVSLPKSVKA